MDTTTIVTIIGSLVSSGLITLLINVVANRGKTLAEAHKLQAEAERTEVDTTAVLLLTYAEHVKQLTTRVSFLEQEHLKAVQAEAKCREEAAALKVEAVHMRQRIDEHAKVVEELKSKVAQLMVTVKKSEKSGA